MSTLAPKTGDSRNRRRLVTVTVLLLTVVALYAGRRHLLPWAARWLDVGEKPALAEYVFVLGGDENVRPFVAAAIVRAGLAKKALASHVYCPPGADDGILISQQRRICEAIKRRGVPAEDVEAVGGQLRTTYDEASALASFLASPSALADARVLVVTSHYHTRRARWIFAQVFGAKADHMQFISAPVDHFTLDNWWQNEEGFTTIVGENVKLVATVILYRPALCLLWAVVLLASGTAAYLVRARIRCSRRCIVLQALPTTAKIVSSTLPE